MFNPVNRLAENFLAVSKKIIPIAVVGNPSQIGFAGIKIPDKSRPTGVLVGGHADIFADNILSARKVYVTILHDLICLGLSQAHS